MTLDVNTIFAQITSHAKLLGKFVNVTSHEPKSAPGNGLTCAIWLRGITPVPEGSGLTQTSARVEFSIRIYQNFLAQPEDGIDKKLLDAASILMNEYSGDFELGGNVWFVDLLGTYGAPLAAEAGYLDQDGKKYRVLVITLPVIVDNVWTRTA